MKPDQLKGRIVLITGASSGIGWAAALELAKHGASLALAARREERLKELSKLLEPHEVQTLSVPCDVSDRAQALAAVEAVIGRWGRIDFLINNAGIMATRRFHEQDLEEIEAVTRTNFLGAATLIRAALPHMLKQGKGHVVNVGSIAGILGLPYMASYCASKFALSGLTEALRREYRGTGVTFTLLCPGSVDTPMSEESLKDDIYSKHARPKTAAQVAEKIVACCLDRRPELVYGEVPGFLVRLAQFAPRLTDWAVSRIYKSIHPLGRRP